MSDELKVLPDFEPSEQEPEVVDSYDEVPEEDEEIELIALIQFMREFLVRLNARVTAIEDFLTKFIEEVEKLGEPTPPSNNESPPRPEFKVVT